MDRSLKILQKDAAGRREVRMPERLNDITNTRVNIHRLIEVLKKEKCNPEHIAMFRMMMDSYLKLILSRDSVLPENEQI